MSKRGDTGEGEVRSYLMGLLLGFAVGAPLAAWLSPRSGEATRREIRQRGMIVRRKAEGTVRQVAELPSRLGEQIGEQVEQIQSKVGLKDESLEDALEQGRAIAARKAAARESGLSEPSE